MRAAAAFLDHAASRGHHVTVVTPEVVGGARVTDTGVLLAPAGGAWDAWGADVLVENWNSQLGMARAARRSGAAYVPLVHSWGVGAASVLAMARPALVWFPSDATRAASQWPGESVVAHPPVDPDRHHTTRGDRVSQVNLSDQKGGALFWRLAEAQCRPMLACLGWGPQVVPDVVPDHVAFVAGTQDMRGDVWSQTRVLLVPSESESWCMTALEACCSGIPVVAHPSPGIVEALGDSAIWCDRDDDQAWLDVLDRLDDPCEYEASAGRAQARADALDPTVELDRFVDALEAACV